MTATTRHYAIRDYAPSVAGGHALGHLASLDLLVLHAVRLVERDAELRSDEVYRALISSPPMCGRLAGSISCPSAAGKCGATEAAPAHRLPAGRQPGTARRAPPVCLAEG